MDENLKNYDLSGEKLIEELENENLSSSSLEQDLKLGDTKKLLKLLNEFILQSYKAEKDFKDFKALFEPVLEMIPQAVIVFNENGSLFYQNKKARSLKELGLLDYSKGDEFEIKIDSSTYLLQSSYISNKQIITATNITEQKRQERLASMGQVSAHLAHEIRNPIGSISLLASALAKRVDKKSLEIVEEMKKSIWRVERIIKSTLLFSKGVQASLVLSEVSQLKKSMDTTILEYTYSKDIDFEFNLALDKLLIDPSLFEIAIQNLLCNAIDAIEEGDCINGKIRICLFKEGDYDVFRIYDNGKKIEDINSLFEAFKTTKLKGHGLGLALSQQIIKVHNGILLANDKEDKYFEIRLDRR